MIVSKSAEKVQKDGLRWFRGQLHSHTYWSDGRGFPEQAVDAHKRLGYDFLCITDHNRFAHDPAVWRKVEEAEGSWPPKITRAIFDAYLAEFGADWVETKMAGDDQFVRLKTFPELQRRFDEPGRFLLMPGWEVTQIIGDRHVHMSYINLAEMIPSIRDARLIMDVAEPKNISELIALNGSEVRRIAAVANTPYILTLNHPFWQYCDVLPQNLIDNHFIRFFEVYPNNSEYAPHPDVPDYKVEKFWDVVNAFRAVRGQSLLYGVGADDAHYYDEARINGKSGVGNASIMVRAEHLTPRDLIAAMHAGDFYATCGVLLDDVSFSPVDKILKLKVQAQPGVNYKINFITTKRDFNRTVLDVDCPAEDKRPARTIPVYSDDIGQTAKTVNGVMAEYQMADDDLYVRALVESDTPCKYQMPFHPEFAVAWTQPYCLGSVENQIRT